MTVVISRELFLGFEVTVSEDLFEKAKGLVVEEGLTLTEEELKKDIVLAIEKAVEQKPLLDLNIAKGHFNYLFKIDSHKELFFGIKMKDIKKKI